MRAIVEQSLPVGAPALARPDSLAAVLTAASAANALARVYVADRLRDEHGRRFCKENFQVREKISLSALAFGCSHALVAKGFKRASVAWKAHPEPDPSVTFAPVLYMHTYCGP